MPKWWKYIINPVGALAQAYNENTGKGKLVNMLTNPGDFTLDTINLIKGFGKDSVNGMIKNGLENLTGDETPDIESGLKNLYDDFTGKSNIELQNELNRQMAEEEYQRNLQSIGDTAAAYEAAGFNRNILYGGSNGSPVSYSAPQLQAYTGSKKLDTILQRTGQVLNMIPAMYQATAALEGIDQARERTKQSEIKTMSMGMSLLDQGYKLGDQFLSKPFTPQFRNGLNPLYYMYPSQRGEYSYNGKILSAGDLGRYADSSLKHQFDLLESIGIKNQLNSTLNDWRGYQYSLDRRFGAAGRIVGMGSQGLRSVGSLFSPIKLKTHL